MVIRVGLVRSIVLVLLATPWVCFGSSAQAATIAWVDWQSATLGNSDANGGAASGTASLGGSTLMVGYTGELYLDTQVDGLGTDHWDPDSTWADGSIVDNAPPGTDILALRGNPDSTNTITFSQPVTNPVMAIFSLGKSIDPASYDFDAPFDVVVGGPSTEFAGSSIVELPNDVLYGEEANGTIQFDGTFTSISFTVPDGESWHGFTVGVAVPAPPILPVVGSAALWLCGIGLASRAPRRRQE